MAVKFLEDACDLPDVLKIVVDMQPTLEHLGEVVNSLMFESRGTDSFQGPFSSPMLGSAQSSSKVHITLLKGIRCVEEEYRSWILMRTSQWEWGLPSRGT